MRRAARIDDNQTEIVQALRKAGYSVQSLAAIGGGCPDLLVGLHGTNWLLEVKDGDKSPSRRKLTDLEQQWHARWQGQVATVCSTDEALAILAPSSWWRDDH